MDHSDANLHLASSVSITFEEQKRGTKNDTISHQRTNNELLCPVKIWCKIIKRIVSYQETTKPSSSGRFLGTKCIRLHFDKIGLHSARSGAAMAMYLAGVPVFTIMLLGRWASDAFLRYIRKEIQEFSNSVSSMMIQNNRFFTIPEPVGSNATSRPGTRNNNGADIKGALKPVINSFKAIQVY
jgi:hypothetical protein